MSDKVIKPDAVLVALAKIDGFPFEKFIQEFASTLMEENFKPLGGVHDGGADGYVATDILENNSGVFVQVSVRDDVSTKIRQTVKRLKEYNREVRKLIYFSSHLVTDIDKIENRLGKDLGCFVDIRDANWIANKINASSGTVAAYKNHLQHLIDVPLTGVSSRSASIDHANTSACVFLSYEIDILSKEEKFQESVIDSLIIWALENTDPSQGKVKTEDEIRHDIIDMFPFAKQVGYGVLRDRLKSLTKRTPDRTRRVQFNSALKGYCLPYESRMKVLEEHTEYESLYQSFKSELSELVDIIVPNYDGDKNRLVDAQIVLLEAIFKKEGLKVSQCISDSVEISETTIQDIMAESLKSFAKSNSEAVVIRQYCAEATRVLVYKPSDIQKKFLSVLSRTYAMLFLLRHEPKVLEYFQKLQSSYHLIVSGELIVRALSEVGLEEDNRSTSNTFKILDEMGSKLYITDHIVDEVVSHIRAMDMEYRNHYAELDNFLKPNLVSDLDKILIRSYYYTKFENKVKSWSEFINKFMTYSNLHKDLGRQSLVTYLTSKFNFKFIDSDDISGLIDIDQKESISVEVFEKNIKRDIRTARVDVENYLLTASLRKKHKEQNAGNPLGYRTWWLTEETKIQPVINSILGGVKSRLAMSPDFILFCVSMLPSRNQVDKSYRNFLPSLNGVRIGAKMDEGLLNEILSKAKEIQSMEPARVNAELELLSNKWQSDQHKRYNLVQDSIAGG